MNSPAVAQGDALGKPRKNPVDSGHQRLDDLDAVKFLEGLRSIFSGKGKNPEVDFELWAGPTRNADDLDIRRKCGQKNVSDLLIDTYTHHMFRVCPKVPRSDNHAAMGNLPYDDA